MRNDNIHQQLIENAIDFIDRSLMEFETDLKYAIIHFAIGVELILKARLMNEHWSLTLENTDKIVYQDFLDGSAKTVSANKLVNRINGLFEKSEINKDANKAFENIFSERNKAIHFINEDFKKNKSKIIKLLFIAWVHLLPLINIWEFIDEKFKNSLVRIDRNLRNKCRPYQEIIYNHGLEDKEHNKKNGYKYFICSSCYFESMKSKNIEGKIYKSECYVCSNNNRSFGNEFFLLNCPQCEKQILFPCGDAFHKECQCKHEFTSVEIKDQLDIDSNHPNEIMDMHDIINCENCMSLYTGIEHYNRIICTECGYSDESISQCEYCCEYVLGDFVSEDSYLCGCPFCDGKLAYDNS